MHIKQYYYSILAFLELGLYYNTNKMKILRTGNWKSP